MQQWEIENVIEQHSDMLYRLALIRTGNREDAEDIVQQTLLKLVENYDKLESQMHVKAWLLRVCCNQCNDYFKLPWKKRRVELENFADYIGVQADCEEEIVRGEQKERLIQEIYKLPEKYRIVFHLCYMEEYTPTEIAEILGISTNAVNVRLNRARKQLAQRLDKEGF